MDKVFSNYQALVEKVDMMCNKIQVHYAKDIACQRGCESCCRHLTLFPVEAVFLRLALDGMTDPDLQQRIRQKAIDATGDDACPLLDDSCCLMYDQRPIICRTHGMPLLINRDGQAGLDYCPMNFKDISDISCLERTMIIDLEQLNTALIVINRVFQEQAIEPHSIPTRLLMSEALLMDVG